MYTFSEIIKVVDDFAPAYFQESYDNVGLCVGQGQQKLTSVLITFDVTEAILDQAIELGANLIISHHPVIFSGIKKLNNQSATTRIVAKAIQHQIGLFSAHTNLDNVQHGVSWHFAKMLCLQNIKTLVPLTNQFVKLVCYVPTTHRMDVCEAMWLAGAGRQGNYSKCAFSGQGEGSFQAGEGSHPYIGSQNLLHLEIEDRVEMLVHRRHLSQVLQAMQQVHPYEEVAYDIINVENTVSTLGTGTVGDLDTAYPVQEFLAHIRSTFDVEMIRTNRFNPDKMIRRVALCGGSGSSFIRNAIANHADIYLTGDCKYHEFIDHQQNIILADIGHYESENFATNLLSDLLTKHFPEISIHISKQNPVIYH